MTILSPFIAAAIGALIVISVLIAVMSFDFDGSDDPYNWE